MCGIAGFSGSTNKEHAHKTLSKMLDSIFHRGPDSFGEWHTEGFSFGMRRLSIIDIAGGEQPIWGDRDCGIVFNGEIYNYRELRQSLEQKNVKFRTHSDTEVIVKLYESKGLNALNDLEGMFAFCLYDPRKKKIYLVRDRFGVKPLYYRVRNGKLSFASETKALIKAADVSSSLRMQSVYDFLTYRFIPNPHTMWEDIFSLAPGSWLEYSLDTGHIDIQRYWSLSFDSRGATDSKEKPVEKFSDLFLNAVNKRLVASDVPVGILLSGGLDSSVVAAAASELGHRDLHSFCIGFDDPRAQNETSYARLVSEHIKTNHHEIVIGPEEFSSFFDEFVYFSDEPLADLASIALYHVCHLAQKTVKVLMAGEGSDEIFAGYNFDRFAKRMALLKILSRLPKQTLPMFPFQSVKDLAKVRLAELPQYQRFFMTETFTENEKEQLWRGSPVQDSQNLLREWYQDSNSMEPLDRVQTVYCGPWLVDDLLMKADKMSMATSVELREPFLDHHLAEWAAKLPIEWRTGSLMSGFTTKRIVREFAKSRLPSAIINRPKQGFPVPAYLWLQDKLKEWAFAKMNDATFDGIISKPAALNILNNASKGDLRASHQAWSLLILAAWMKRWL